MFGQQGELAMTINIGEECAHNEIQLLYTESHSFFSLQKDEWYMVPALVKRREEIRILPCFMGFMVQPELKSDFLTISNHEVDNVI